MQSRGNPVAPDMYLDPGAPLGSSGSEWPRGFSCPTAPVLPGAPAEPVAPVSLFTPGVFGVPAGPEGAKGP